MTLNDCTEYLRARDGFLIVTHTRPDGDTLGSAAALCSALRRMGKTAYLFPNPEITPKYMGYVQEFISSAEICDCVIAVDVAEERMYCEGFTGRAELCIDHHPTNPEYADNNLVFGDRAACGEIVLELIETMCGSVSSQEASLLYIAVSTDTGCFRYANVTAATFAAASRLTEYGADIREINFKIFRQMSKARMLLEGEICAGMKFFHDNELVIATLTLETMEKCGAEENDCDDIAAIPGRAEGCVVSILIRELEEGKCKVSLRSHPQFDCSAVALRFSGGGHRMASGCTIYETPEKCFELIKDAVLEDMR